MFEFMSGWLTPTSFFLLLNIVIGTIWATHKKHHHQQPLDHRDYSSSPPRSRSLVDRVKSINFGIHNPDPDAHDHSSTLEPLLIRVPALLKRVRSVTDFHFSFFASQPRNPEPEIPEPTEPEHDSETEEDTVQYGTRSEQLARPPSLLQRVKSIKFPELPLIVPFSVFRSDSENSYESDQLDDGATDRRQEVEEHVARSKSEVKMPARRVVEKMSKSASEKMAFWSAEETDVVEKRRPATARVERSDSIGDEEVDSKADDFINKFKQQLKLQRLDSLIRYKDMITRGASR